MNDFSPRYISYMYSYPHKTAYRTFDPPLDMATCIKQVTNQQAGLYFHLPYCRSKCGFCNLFSLQGAKEVDIDAYLDTLLRQAQQVAPLVRELEFTSLAIGGGTPLLLNSRQLDMLFKAAALFNVSPKRVFTSVETSPDFADSLLLRQLKEIGVRRLSIGIQSFHAEELLQLKRKTALSTCLSALEVIRQIDFPEFNIDLIYGIEGQTVESLLTSIDRALSYCPTELFLYPLYVRSGVGITEKAGNEMRWEMYQAGRARLLEEGFIQTSMRRFVRHHSPDLEYSCGDETVISCGCGGRSYLGDLHFATPYAVRQKKIREVIDAYVQTTDFTKISNGYLLSPEEKRRRYIIKNLMYYRGVDLVDYHVRFGHPFPLADLNNLSQKEFIKEDNGFLHLTPEGMAYSDDIGPMFISESVRQQMEQYRME